MSFISLNHPEKKSVPLHIDILDGDILDGDINSPIPLYSIPEISNKEFTDYDKFYNDYIREKQELKLPDIKIHVQDNFEPLFYKRTEIKKTEQLPLVKKVTPLKVGQMAKYGQMLFEYKGGF